MAVIVYWTVRIEQFATHVGLHRFDLGIITTTSLGHSCFQTSCAWTRGRQQTSLRF